MYLKLVLLKKCIKNGKNGYWLETYLEKGGLHIVEIMVRKVSEDMIILDARLIMSREKTHLFNKKMWSMDPS